MNADFLAVLEFWEREKGINRDVLVGAVQEALLSAAKKAVGPARELRVEIDQKNGDIKAFAKLIVSEKVISKHDQISVFDARRIKPDAQVGDEIEKEVTPTGFGRIASQYAKQALMQKVRQAEKALIFTEFKDRVGDIVSGTVRRFERSDVILDLGKYEALLPNRERVPTEEYQVGERIRCYVKAVEEGPHGPEIILSRADPRFIIKLFQVEVSEISDGTIEIKGIAREPGFRTKMAVYSRDPKVDPGRRVRRDARPAREKHRPRAEQRKGGRDSVVAGHPDVCHEGAGAGQTEKHRGGRGGQAAENFGERRPVVAGHRQARPERAADGEADRLGSGH